MSGETNFGYCSARCGHTSGVGVNPVSAYFHDHLFVPAERADEAIVLEQLAAEARG